MASERTVSDVVAARVREVRGKRGKRGKRGMTVAALAARCAELGAPGLTAQALYKLEGRRNDPAERPPRPVTVDELLILARALNTPPLHLLVPPDDDDAPTPVTPGTEVPAVAARRWIRGFGLLANLPNVGELREYMTEVPDSEFPAVDDGLPQRLLTGRLQVREQVMFAKARDDDEIRQATPGWFASRDKDGA